MCGLFINWEVEFHSLPCITAENSVYCMQLFVHGKGCECRQDVVGGTSLYIIQCTGICEVNISEVRAKHAPVRR